MAKTSMINREIKRAKLAKLARRLNTVGWLSSYSSGVPV